jgi:transcription regulator MmyB-like protein/helix-turn-helix protein
MTVHDAAPHGRGRVRVELRDFLRTRRARLSPADVGLPAGGPRRTPGLRREEVAVLAGVGVSWYTWLEQGRDIKVSDSVLDAISRTLLLNEAEREYLYRLAGLNPPAPAMAGCVAPVSPELRRLLDGWAVRPACLLDEHWNLRAINDASRAVLGADETGQNLLKLFMTSDLFRAAGASWAEMAPLMVARFRGAVARSPDDPEFQALVDELSAASPDFVRLWARHEVEAEGYGIKAVVHPDAGDLTFEWTSLSLPDQPGCQLVLHTPFPGTDTFAKMTELMSSVRQ